MQRTILIAALTLLLQATDHASAQLIVAHRGASHDAPENTLAAFRLAWERQADAIEGDFYLTKDQEIVCIHDKSTKRVAPQQEELVVADSTLKQLRSVDVGSWKAVKYAGEKIPTLKEVLATIPAGKRILVEIKCGPEILPFLKKQLAASGLKDAQVVIICFNAQVVTECRKTMPQYKANWLTAYDKKPPHGWKPNKTDVITALTRTNATGLGSHGNLTVIDQAFVDSVRAAKKELHVWTVNMIADAQAFKSFGVDSITTDRPAFIRSAINFSSTPANALELIGQ